MAVLFADEKCEDFKRWPEKVVDGVELLPILEESTVVLCSNV